MEADQGQLNRKARGRLRGREKCRGYGGVASGGEEIKISVSWRENEEMKRTEVDKIQQRKWAKNSYNN